MTESAGVRPARCDRAPKYRRRQPSVRRGLLVEAALRCLAKGGIQGFTIDRICREAGVSRGLINHYFDGKDGLLIEVYRGSLYAGVSKRIERAAAATPEGSPPEALLAAIVEATFHPEFFSRERLRIWLALWDEIAVNETLRAVHRELYDAYRDQIATVVQRVASARGLRLDPGPVAQSFVALVDGLWLEWCLDETSVDPARARAATLAMLEAQTGGR